MIELREIIQTNLKKFHPRAFFQSAPETAEFPYLVFEIINVNLGGEYYEQAVIDIDGWSDSKDTTELERLMKGVELMFDKQTFSVGNVTATFFIDSKKPVLSDNSKLQRRKYTFQVRIFRRG